MSLLRRATRLLTSKTAVLVCFVVLLFVWLFNSPTPKAAIQQGHPLFANLSPFKEHKSLQQDADAVCAAHGYKPWRKPGRKVYDLTMITSELDLLEIRLRTLNSTVDHFIVIESNTTFTGLSKPLTLRDNWSQFKKWHHKMTHSVVVDPITSNRLWDHEAWFRNSMLTAALSSDRPPQDGDVLIISDQDELIRPETAMLLRYCDFPARLTLRSQFYYYAFRWKHRGDWPHPQATVYRGDKTILPEALRMNLLESGFALLASWRRSREQGQLFNAGWHCSYCFSTIQEVLDKMDASSHQVWNTPENRDPKMIIERVKWGRDLFNRAGEIYDKLEWLSDVPEYIMFGYYEVARFGYLLDRSSEYAEFKDGKEKLAESS